MERAIRTVATGVVVVSLFYAFLIPGSLARRAGVGLATAALGMAVFLGGMYLCNLPLQAGYLETATGLGLLVCYLTVDLPSRAIARLQEVDLGVARGVTLTAMVTSTFIAAWVAGMPEIPQQIPQGASPPAVDPEVGHGGP
jgi:hypothetical protein